MGASPGRDELQDARAHAEAQARSSPSGIGAGVVGVYYQGDDRAWRCVVSDASEWHYIQVLGTGLGLSLDPPPEEIELAVARFAATLPEAGRLGHLLNANPLHIDRQGVVVD